MSNYPGTIDTFNVIGTANTMDEPGYVLHEHLNTHGSAIVALETKVGNTATTAQADIGRRIFTKIVSTDASGDYQTDGTDDDVQIQAAIDAVEAAGGGTVFLRAGTYVISAQLLIDSSNVRIYGEGVGSTIIQLKAAFPTDDYAILISGSGTTRSSVENLTIDGNKANQTTENHLGVGVYDEYCTVKNVYVKNMNRNSSKGTGFDIEANSCYLSGCVADGCEGSGFYLYNITKVDRITLVGCVANNNSLYGFSADAGAQMISCTAKDNNVADGGYSNFFSGGDRQVAFIGCVSSGAEHGIYLTDSTTPEGNVISGCNVFGAENDGIVLDAVASILVSNNYVEVTSSLDADNTYSGILLTGTATRNIIAGNRVVQNGGTNNLQYGIREAASADDYNIITNNIVTDAQTAQISSQGANTDVSHNITN